ncbi:phage holin [Clostridium estertheticum]|uniref:phage holin n=1 Tax=Clostridium estertheticum TaxID=238834 RepID=UPI001C0B11FF|nr:phage holin [Clostridium estertheticum]MBU3213514.1 holin [Clostridium estertheticum]WAG57829.1 phage holin [Clostridium estertheticum]
MKFDKSRFKNYSLWVAIIALVPLVLSGFGVAIVPATYTAVTNSVLAILVAMGILSNPLTSGITDK